jgi:electron transport complex protein RnfB
MQIQRLDSQIVKNLFKYYKQSYGLSYLSTEIPQMRVIPIEQSILPSHNIASYDEVRTLINNVKGPICISNCICRTGMETLGTPCKKTHRKETCMGFNRFAEQYIRSGWGRVITKEEALDIIQQNEKEGLILEPSNNQDIEFLCSCCSDCCGMMFLYKSIPRPADFIASNFQAIVTPELCTGCGVCTTRCVMKAPKVNIETKKAFVNLGRCIGCGVCIPTCKVKAINLIRRTKEQVPPVDPDALYNVLRNHKNKKWQKLKTGLKIVLKMKR